MEAHTDAICLPKNGTKIVTSAVSFIYECPICKAEQRYEKPTGKDEIIHDGLDFRCENPNKPFVVDQPTEEEQDNIRIKKILSRISNKGINVNPFPISDEETIQELLDRGLIERDFILTEKALKKLDKWQG